MTHTFKSLLITTIATLPSLFAAEPPHLKGHQEKPIAAAAAVTSLPTKLTKLKNSFDGVIVTFSSKSTASTVRLSREGFVPIDLKGYEDLRGIMPIFTMWDNGLDISEKERQLLVSKSDKLKRLSAEISKMRAVEVIEKMPITSSSGEIFPNRRPNKIEQLDGRRMPGKKSIWMEGMRMTHQRIDFIDGTYLIAFINRDNSSEQLSFNKQGILDSRTFLGANKQPLKEIYYYRDGSEKSVEEFNPETGIKCKYTKKQNGKPVYEVTYDQLERPLRHVEWYPSGNIKSVLILDPVKDSEGVSKTTFYDDAVKKTFQKIQFSHGKISVEEIFYESTNIRQRIKFFENGSVERLQTFSDEPGSLVTSDIIEIAPAEDDTVADFEVMKILIRNCDFFKPRDPDAFAWGAVKFLNNVSGLFGGKGDSDDVGVPAAAAAAAPQETQLDTEGDGDSGEEIIRSQRALDERLKQAEEKVREFKLQNLGIELTDEEQPKSVVHKFNSALLTYTGGSDETYLDILKEVRRIGGVVVEGGAKSKIYLKNEEGVKLPIINMHKFHRNSGRASINSLRKILMDHGLLDTTE